jgi:hypothetical protein
MGFQSGLLQVPLLGPARQKEPKTGDAKTDLITIRTLVVLHAFEEFVFVRLTNSSEAQPRFVRQF